MALRAPVNDSKQFACPHCGYDLRVTTTKVCPECGRGFRFVDGHMEKRPQDWTLADGLKQLCDSLARRFVVAIPAFVAMIYLGAIIIPTRGGRGMAIFAALGIPAGYIVGRNLVERAGFTGWVLHAGAILCLGTAAAATIAFLAWMAPPAISARVVPAGFVVGVGAIVTACWCVHRDS